MLKIKMLSTTSGSQDGSHIQQFLKDQEYEINNDLAETFVEMGAAVIVRERKMAPGPSDNKMMEGPPINKQPEVEPDEQKEKVTEPERGIRIFQLADELGLPSKKILAVAKELGIEVSVAASKISQEDASKIKVKLGK